MPTYEYLCKACGHRLEEFQSITEPPLQTCPQCNTDNLARVMGSGAGVIFKGTGFYLTDYRRKSGPAEAKEPSPGPAKKPDEPKTPPSSTAS